MRTDAELVKACLNGEKAGVIGSAFFVCLSCSGVCNVAYVIFVVVLTGGKTAG